MFKLLLFINIRRIFSILIKCWQWNMPVYKCNWARFSYPVSFAYTHIHTKLSKADKLSRTGPSSSSSFIHQHSTLWATHPIEQTFILSILQFPSQSSFQAWCLAVSLCNVLAILVVIRSNTAERWYRGNWIHACMDSIICEWTGWSHVFHNVSPEGLNLSA